MNNKNQISQESLDTIVSVLIDNKIEAEKYNKNGINDAYIEAINKALGELKPMFNR